MKLIFIRHGDPNYEKDSLTDKGWREAELLAKRVEEWNVKEFFVSPLGRAQDTARVSLEKIGRKAKTLDWLKEFAVLIDDPMGGKKWIPWDFLPSWWTKQEILYDRDRWALESHLATGSVETEQKKVIRGIDSLLKEYGYVRKERYYEVINPNKDTLVFFCHMGVQLLILSHLLGIAAPVLWHGMFTAPTSVTILCTEEQNKGEAFFRCKCLGDTSHLYVAKEEPSNSGFFKEIYE